MGIRTFFLYVSLLICIVLAFVAGFLSHPLLAPFLARTWVEPQAPLVEDYPMTAIVPDPVDMTVFWQVNSILERDFFGPKPDLQSRRYGAINGLVASFNDMYTRYEPPSQSVGSGAAICGCEGVIGVTIEQTAAGFVLHPLPDLPAQKTGVLDGDLLIQVNDTPITTTLTVDDVMQLVNGQPDTEVIMVVQRQMGDGADSEILNFQITRVEVVKPSMEWRLLDTDTHHSTIGYIRQFHFTDHSPEEMEQALHELVAQGANRFILDLRNNPGGTVDAALKITDMWLDEGVMLIEEDASGAEKQFEATKGQVVANAPLVLMIDHGSASASEIVAGALHDYKRATLVGTQTYGKGSVQLRHELADQSSLFVTNALWYTPQRQQISGVGLMPDITVDGDHDPLRAAITSVQQIAVAQR